MVNILISGATGLIGSQLTQHFSEAGCNVSCIVNNTELPKLNNVKSLHIQNLKNDGFFYNNEPDFIFHLAQSPYYNQFPHHTDDVFRVNVQLTQDLIDIALKYKVKRFIYASSGGVYKSSQSILNEESPLINDWNINPYQSSKISSELLLKSHSSLFDVSILRIFFCYGGGQKSSMLIPRIIDNIKKQTPITLSGEEGLIFNPVYVEDAIKAFYKTLDTSGSSCINLAGPENISLRQLSEKLGELLGSKPIFKKMDDKKVSFSSSIEQMKTHLFVPQFTPLQGVQDMIAKGFI